MAPVLLLVVATATSAFAQKQTSRPPRELHRVGEHWTAYYPPDPATYPAGARTHTIRPGDTLWDLAQQYYNNGYLWPQLWESNTWITDAHWIYPGDVLLIEGEGTATAAGTAAETGAAAGATADDRTMAEDANAFTATTGDDGMPVARVTPVSNPVAIGTEADIYCYGYIGDPNEPMPNFIESHEDYEVKYVPRAAWMSGSAAEGDLVFVRGDASTGLVAGETYIAVEPADMIYHPGSGEPIGRQYDYVGQVRILCTETGRSRAIITQSCREVNLGARLKPMPELPIPIARIPEMPDWCDAPTNRNTGYIVDSRSWDLGLVEGHLVQVNLGSEHRLEPGDFLTVFRPSPHPNQPRVVLGEIGILTTDARTATGVIVASRREMFVGDQVEAR